MVDITKCKGDGCPIKEKCYRFTVPGDSTAQYYFTFEPYNHEEKKCTQFWDNVGIK